MNNKTNQNNYYKKHKNEEEFNAYRKMNNKEYYLKTKLERAKKHEEVKEVYNQRRKVRSLEKKLEEKKGDEKVLDKLEKEKKVLKEIDPNVNLMSSRAPKREFKEFKKKNHDEELILKKFKNIENIVNILGFKLIPI